MAAISPTLSPTYDVLRTPRRQQMLGPRFRGDDIAGYKWQQFFPRFLWYAARLAVECDDAGFDNAVGEKRLAAPDLLVRCHARAGQRRRPCMNFDQIVEPRRSDVFERNPAQR